MILLKLALRAAIFGLMLWWVISASFAFFPSLLFIVVSSVLYAQPMFNTFELSISFVVLLLLAFFTSLALSAGAHSPFSWALAFGVLFYVLLGSKRVAFKHRFPWYLVLHLTLVYAAFLLFFSFQQPGWFLISSLLLWAVLTLLLREFFRFSRHQHSPRLRLIVNMISFVMVELVWAIRLLPVGFLNAAGLALLSFYLLEEMAQMQLSGTWNKKSLLINAGITSTLAVAILWTSQWTL